MKRCTVLRERSAPFGRICHSQSLLRSFASRGKRDAPASSSPPAPAQKPSDESFKVDQDAKTVETVVGTLPLSPIMDPSYFEAVGRFKKKKANPGRPLNSVERQFRINPYARALATHIRFDPVTRVRLPRFFLQDFDFITHPETGANWWAPRSLALNKSPEPTEIDKEEAEEEPEEVYLTEEDLDTDPELETAQPKEDLNADPELKTAQPKVARSTAQPKLPAVFGPSTYVMARQDILASFNDRKSGFAKMNLRLMPTTSTLYKILTPKTVWRTDMDTFVLDQMRQQIVLDLLYLSRLCVEQDRYYIVKCHGWDDVQYKNKGAVLWLEPATSADGPSEKNAPGPFATFEFVDEAPKGSGGAVLNPVKVTLAVHNLAMLLGAEYFERVKNEAAVFKDGSVFMLAGRRTTELQGRLWKLQGYIATTEELMKL